jgi:hypothetical protein
MPRQPSKNYLNSTEFDEKMGREISKHVADLEKKYGTVETTLSFEQLLSKKKRKRYGKGVARPQNAFIIYRKEIQARFKSEGKRLSLAQVSAATSKLWTDETADMKQLFLELGEVSAAIHKEIFPAYRFCSKNQKRNVKKASKRKTACRGSDDPSPVLSNPPVVFTKIVTPEFFNDAHRRNTTNDASCHVLPTGSDENIFDIFGTVSLGGENQVDVFDIDNNIQWADIDYLQSTMPADCLSYTEPIIDNVYDDGTTIYINELSEVTDTVVDLENTCFD